jgi:probable phosphoglycerate mutase
MATTIYLIRHGQTYFNCFARLQGWSDTPLTEQGEADAVNIGQTLAELKVDYLFSSDMKRAIDTAKIMIAQNNYTPNKIPVAKSLFREVFYGSFEGHSNEEGAIWASRLGNKRFRRIGQLVAEFGVEKSHDLLKEADPAHLAEGSKELNQRVAEMMNLFEQLGDQKRVIVATHGSIIQYLASRIDGTRTYPNLDNGAMMKLVMNEGRPRIATYNSKHL